MQVHCWGEVESTRAAHVVQLRRLRTVQVDNLHKAIRAARSGGGDELVYELERGFSDPVRGLARLVVGLGVVIVMLTGVVAFLAPSAAVVLISAALLPAALLATVATVLGYRIDTGLRIFADGRMRSDGWGGTREVNLRDYQRVTLRERRIPEVSEAES